MQKVADHFSPPPCTPPPSLPPPGASLGPEGLLLVDAGKVSQTVLAWRGGARDGRWRGALRAVSARRHLPCREGGGVGGMSEAAAAGERQPPSNCRPHPHTLHPTGAAPCGGGQATDGGGAAAPAPASARIVCASGEGLVARPPPCPTVSTRQPVWRAGGLPRRPGLWGGGGMVEDDRQARHGDRRSGSPGAARTGPGERGFHSGREGARA